MRKLSKILFMIMVVIGYADNGRASKFLTIKQQTGLQVGTFNEKEVPKEIDGCSGYFYRTMDDRKASKYVGINDLGRVAFIKIGNKLERFSQIKTSNVNNKPLWIYQNKDKSIKLTMQVQSRKGNGSESSFIKGIITIETTDGRKTIIPFVGDIAC